MKALKKEMVLKGLSNTALAKKINVSPVTVHYWLNGHSRPWASNVKKLKQLGFSDIACLEPSRDVEI